MAARVPKRPRPGLSPVDRLRVAYGDEVALSAVLEVDAIDRDTGLADEPFWQPLTFNPKSFVVYPMETALV